MSSTSETRPTLLCVFSRLLGNKTFTARLVETLDGLDSVSASYLFYEVEDFRRYPAPPLARLGDNVETSWRIRKKFRDVGQRSFDLLFFQGFGLVLPFRDLIRRYPTALALDTTPALARHLRLHDSDGSRGLWKTRFGTPLLAAVFRRICRHLDLVLPRTEWCADSLVSTYRVPADRIRVTYCPMDLSVWHPGGRQPGDKLALLFCGNDFKRKGGEFLVNLFRNHLSRRCTLTVVSNDDLSGIDVEGVEIIRGVTHEQLARLVEIYQRSDLFLFPTRRDQLGIALAEAVATGLPAMATDVGGIKELVRTGHNGYLMPQELREADWVERILHLADSPETLAGFRKNSRALAEEKLDLRHFQSTVARSVDHLIRLMTKPGQAPARTR